MPASILCYRPIYAKRLTINSETSSQWSRQTCRGSIWGDKGHRGSQWWTRVRDSLRGIEVNEIRKKQAIENVKVQNLLTDGGGKILKNQLHSCSRWTASHLLPPMQPRKFWIAGTNSRFLGNRGGHLGVEKFLGNRGGSTSVVQEFLHTVPAIKDNNHFYCKFYMTIDRITISFRFDWFRIIASLSRGDTIITTLNQKRLCLASFCIDAIWFYLINDHCGTSMFYLFQEQYFNDRHDWSIMHVSIWLLPHPWLLVYSTTLVFFYYVMSSPTLLTRGQFLWRSPRVLLAGYPLAVHLLSFVSCLVTTDLACSSFLHTDLQSPGPSTGPLDVHHGC